MFGRCSKWLGFVCIAFLRPVGAGLPFLGLKSGETLFRHASSLDEQLLLLEINFNDIDLFCVIFGFTS
jgi:hypothetical protein